MRDKYLIGVDGGSQSSKVTVFDLGGDVVCEGRRPLRPTSSPRPGFVEHPDDDLWESIAAASQQAMASFPGDRDDILGVGLCTIRCCKAFLRRDGSLAMPVMSWMDVRAHEAYLPNDPAVAYATTSSGYLTHRFTGQFRDTAANNILEQWPIDTDTWRWSEDAALLREYGVPRDMLFDLQMPGDVLGHVTPEAALATGIPQGLPVVSTANDKAVEALGSGCLDDRMALVSLGTYITAMVNGRENRKAPDHFWTNFASVPGQYLYESKGIRRGMWTLTWYMELFGEALAEKAQSLGLSREQYLEREAARVPPGSDGLMTVLDWIAPFDENRFRKGVMIGFDERHTRAHIYRSILEAIALTMKNHADAMCEELGIALESVAVSGGGAQSPLFMQIFADVFGIRSVRSVRSGGAGLGAAICAAVATGCYPDFDTAVDRMTGEREAFEPEADSARIYRQMNEAAYRSIRTATDGVLERTYPIFR